MGPTQSLPQLKFASSIVFVVELFAGSDIGLKKQ